MKVDRASIITAVGQDVTLNCTVSGSPQPTMRWLRYNDRSLVLGNYHAHFCICVSLVLYSRSEIRCYMVLMFIL